MPATVLDLSNEILQLVINDLARPGWPRESLLNARLVCQRFQQLAHPISLLNIRTAVEHINVCIQSVVVKDDGPRYKRVFRNELCSEFEKVLPHFPRLKTVNVKLTTLPPGPEDRGACFSHGSIPLEYEPPASILYIPKLEKVDGEDLVKVFYDLRDRKKGKQLETLLYRQISDGEEEECMLWHLGGRRVLLSFRYQRGAEWREMYEGTKLVRMEKRPFEQGRLFDEETFPG
ncbi:MAG: hypothetical protein Q9182_000928 [Xanthomendoza sp. 2 TL-2023]